MQHLQRLAINLLERPQRRQREAVVAAEGDELGLGQGRRQRLPAAELAVGLGHLLHGDDVVHGRDGNVAAVEDGGPILVWVDAGARVEAAERRLPARGVPNGARAETGTGTIGHGCVKGHADDANVVQLAGVRQALDVLQVGKGADAREAYSTRSA